MRIRFIAAPTAVLMSLSIISGPAFAQDAELDAVEECPAPDLSGVPFADAAATAIAAIDVLTAEDSTCPELEESRERAVEALEAAVLRLPEDGAGVAGEVLAALIRGDSPAGIGADHGAAMANAAAERRNERGQGEGRHDDAVETEVVDEDVPAAPATPAEPAVPATPAVPDEAPAEPATPAIPAQPVQPEIPVQRGRPTDG